MAKINTPSNDTFDQEFEGLNHDQLLDTAKRIQKAYHECRREKERQQELLRRALSFPSSLDSVELQPSWIRAEVDSPTDTVFSCFGERSRYREFLVYDRNASTLEIRPRECLKGIQGVIYARIPSRTANAVHLFVECASTATSDSYRKFRISTDDRTPTGFVPHCTIHFRRLNWNTRRKLWTGQIKWIFILPNQDNKVHEKSKFLRSDT